MLDRKAADFNARQMRYREYYDTEGRGLLNIQQELQQIRLLLVALNKHLGIK